jgi:putative oxidoreductase
VEYGLLLLRLVLGLTFAAHGSQKLFGAFGGPGLRGAAEYLGGLGYRAPLAMAFVAGSFEMASGILLACGLLTPLAALTIAVLMLNAIGAELLRNGFWVRFGGCEYALLIWTIAVALAATGPGQLSLDAALGWSDELSGGWWALGVAALSLILASATLVLGRRPGAAAETNREASTPMTLWRRPNLAPSDARSPRRVLKR